MDNNTIIPTFNICGIIIGYKYDKFVKKNSNKNIKFKDELNKYLNMLSNNKIK